MFVQVFHGRLSDPDLWVAQVDRWRREVRPMTTGFLGFTTGVTSDARMVTVARFDSEEKARVDSDLPEQGAWFAAASKAFDGDITFHDCPQVDVLLDGGSDKAGFVQVMQGRAKDQAALRTLLEDVEKELRRTRPDVIGATISWDSGGGFTQATYFTSEPAARENESSPAGTALYARLAAQVAGALTFYDLTEPEYA